MKKIYKIIFAILIAIIILIVAEYWKMNNHTNETATISHVETPR